MFFFLSLSSWNGLCCSTTERQKGRMDKKWFEVWEQTVNINSKLSCVFQPEHIHAHTRPQTHAHTEEIKVNVTACIKWEIIPGCRFMRNFSLTHTGRAQIIEDTYLTITGCYKQKREDSQQIQQSLSLERTVDRGMRHSFTCPLKYIWWWSWRCF